MKERAKSVMSIYQVEQRDGAQVQGCEVAE